jgi:hypothetical protein
LAINGWTIFAHPLFLDQIETLIRQVEAHKQKDPSGYLKKNASKRLLGDFLPSSRSITQRAGSAAQRLSDDGER